MAEPVRRNSEGWKTGIMDQLRGRSSCTAPLMESIIVEISFVALRLENLPPLSQNE